MTPHSPSTLDSVNWSRISAVTVALCSTAFQVVTEAHAAPSVSANPPWLDGRPTIEHVAPGPRWRPDDDVLRYVRFDAGVGPTYGLIDRDVVHAIGGTPFAPLAPTGRTHRLGAVRLLAPLGPDVFGRAWWPGPGSGDAPEALDLGAADLLDPGADLSLRVGERAFPVLGLVVDGSGDAPTLFGVTAGVLALGSPFRPSLVLGPAITRGVDPLALSVSVGGKDPRTGSGPVGDPFRAELRRARASLGQGGVHRGDVLLVPLTEAITAPSSGSRELRVRVDQVGDLRCGLRR